MNLAAKGKSGIEYYEESEEENAGGQRPAQA